MSAVASSSMRRARLVSAGAFGLAAAAFGLAGLLLLDGGGVARDPWLLAAVPLAFGTAGAVAGAALAPLIEAAEGGATAAATGAVVTVVAAFAYGAGILAASALEAIVGGHLPFQGFDPEGLLVVAGFLLLGSIPGMPFGAAAGWWAWRRLRP